MLEGLRSWWTRGRVLAELSALDDRLLADRGLCRAHLRRHLHAGHACTTDNCEILASIEARRQTDGAARLESVAAPIGAFAAARLHHRAE